MDQWLLDNLVCPKDKNALKLVDDTLICSANHVYPIIDDIPIMLLADVEQTSWAANGTFKQIEEYRQSQRPLLKDEECNPEGIDPVVQEFVAATNGMLYVPIINKLTRYPIPEIRLPPGSGQVLLDVGCNWGRWCIAAAYKGYNPVGIDPSLGAVLAAQRVSKQLGITARYVVADARYLPFKSTSFDIVFSYSVLQHFSKSNARLALREIARVLKDQGISLIQMPNKVGIRNLYHQVRRRFREGVNFDVRYWSLRELQKTFTNIIGPSTLSVDGYFGLGIQKSDIDLLPRHYQLIVRSSELLRMGSEKVSLLRSFADSIYIKSIHNISK